MFKSALDTCQYQLRLVQFAFLFYTRIPVHALPDSLFDSGKYTLEKLQNQCSRYFILIGFVVGCLSALSFYGFSLIFPTLIAVILSTTISILMTGAFHEDGLADSLDGLGGGWSKQQILDIMKDSRIGTYGFTGLMLTLLTKVSALFYIASHSLSLTVIALILAHMTSRWWSMVFMTAMDYVRLDEQSKSKPITKGFGQIDFAWANFVFLILSFLFFAVVLSAFEYPESLTGLSTFKDFELLTEFIILTLICLLSPIPILFYFYNKIRHWLQGYTGDILGAIQQFAEVSAYLGLLIIVELS